MYAIYRNLSPKEFIYALKLPTASKLNDTGYDPLVPGGDVSFIKPTYLFKRSITSDTEVTLLLSEAITNILAMSFPDSTNEILWPYKGSPTVMSPVLPLTEVTSFPIALALFMAVPSLPPI